MIIESKTHKYKDGTPVLTTNTENELLGALSPGEAIEFRKRQRFYGTLGRLPMSAWPKMKPQRYLMGK